MAEVSVIIPVYNAEQYIFHCLKSIAESDFDDFEVIVVDDGSTDSSAIICDEFAQNDERFVVIHEENHGVSYARNNGLDHSNGKYIIFVDADDYIGKNRISNLIVSGNADYIQSGYTNITGSGEIELVEHNRFILIDQYRTLLLNGEIVLPSFVWCTRYKNSIIQENHIRFQENKYLGEDILFNLDYLEYCDNIQFVEHCDYWHNNIKTSLVHQFYLDREQKEEQESRALEEFCKKENMRKRFFCWHNALNHFQMWQKKGDDQVRLIAKTKEKQCYKNSYFRESIRYIRANGSVDERIETYLMGYYRHKLFKPILKVLKVLKG